MKVYITAPFFSKLNEEGIVEKSFIEFINMIDLLVKEFNFSTYITFRDFLQWGKVAYNPDTVYEKFMKELKSSDILLAINPDEGSTLNLVIGIAASLKKDMIILLNKNLDIEKEKISDLMYQGLRNLTNATIIFYNDIDDLKRKLRKSLKEFLIRYKGD